MARDSPWAARRKRAELWFRQGLAVPSTLLEVSKLYNVVGGIRAALRRSTCPLCSGPALDGAFCDGCAGDLPWRRSPLLDRRVAGLDAVCAAFDYRFPLSELIRAGKFRRDLAALRALSLTLAGTAIDALPQVDCLVPVPLPPGRYIHRGYNQAVLLASELVVRGKCLLLPDVLRIKGRRPPQSALSARERQRNIDGAFLCTKRFDGAAVGILDDVITTGATMAAAASVLRACGASHVFGLALAAVPRKPAR